MGRVAALADRCRHRAAPPHMGTVVEEGIQCGYHGLVINGSGRCVRVPGGSARSQASKSLCSCQRNFGGPPLWRPNSWHGAERIRFPRARYAAVLLDRSRPVPAMKSGIFRNYVADTPIGSRSRSAQPRARSPHSHPRHPYPNPTPRPRSARRYAYHVDRPTPPAANYINGLCSKEGKVRIRTKALDGDSQGSPLSCARHRGNSSWGM